MPDELSSIELNNLERMIRDARRWQPAREKQRVVIHPDDLERLMDQAKRGAAAIANDRVSFNGARTRPHRPTAVRDGRTREIIEP